MDLRSEHYIQAAVERIEQARQVHRLNLGPSLVAYLAGVGAECVLRAWLTRESPAFEGRHDLLKLYQKSKLWLIDIGPSRPAGMSEEQLEADRRAMSAAIETLHLIWHNNLRYASTARWKAHLHRMGRLEGIKGDAPREIARRLLDAADIFVTKGIELWKSSGAS